ncbi:MAG: hypothetical protein ABSA78_06790 [Candidatus Sulfotelmatobacter sp.]|jgi:hypothetical protein
MKSRPWIGTLLLVSTFICVSALLFAAFGTGAGRTVTETHSPQAPQEPQSSASEPRNYDGVITDTRCGAKHSAAIGQSAADCTRACVHGGERFALVDGDKMYALEGESEALKHAAGERVTIVGTLSGSTISVASVRVPAR